MNKIESIKHLIQEKIILLLLKQFYILKSFIIEFFNYNVNERNLNMIFFMINTIF